MARIRHILVAPTNSDAVRYQRGLGLPTSSCLNIYGDDSKLRGFTLTKECVVHFVDGSGDISDAILEAISIRASLARLTLAQLMY